MAALFNATDLARAETVSRTLLSPLTAPSIDDWRRDVNRAMRDLFGGDGALFMLPGRDVLYLSDDATEVIGDLGRYAEMSAEGLHVVHDPVVTLWHTMRRTEGMTAFSWDTNAAMIGRHGEQMDRSPLVREVLWDNGVHDFVGTYSTCRFGEVLLWVLHERYGSTRFGDDSVNVMRAFAPSLKAGLDAIDQLAAHRAALDLVAEPMAVFDLGGREVYRNAALAGLMAGDPESDQVLITLRLVADEARRAYAPRPFDRTPSPFAAASRRARTRRGQYDVRATIVGAGAFDRDESIVASVRPILTPSLPSAAALQTQFGLTPREAEIAVLLADGLSNTAIADRLFISPHTTKRHVEKVLDKLDLPSRAGVHAKLMQLGG